MATFSQGFQNENLLIHRGKVGNELKSEHSKLAKTVKKPLGKAGERPKAGRKALGDVSNIRKPLNSTRLGKDPSSALKFRDGAKSTQKSGILTEEQIKKSQEWAQEGTEHMYYTGNDIQKLETDCMEKRVKEEVSMVMSSIHGWENDMFDLMSPTKDGVDDSGLKLELEPEILSSRSGKACNKPKPEVPKLIKTAQKTSRQTGERPKTERKALGDLSNISKPLISANVRGDLSSVPGFSKGTKSTQKSDSSTEEQLKKCQEWAEEDIEHMHFTGNDIQKLERDCLEKRVKEEIAMVTSSMHEWGNDMFGLLSPIKDILGDSELKLEFEPEILPSISDKRRCYENRLDCLFDESESDLEDFDFKLDVKMANFSSTN